jgi:hypothetical protein
MSAQGDTPGGVASNPDGNALTPAAAAVPETNVDDDMPPSLLNGEDDGGDSDPNFRTAQALFMVPSVQNFGECSSNHRSTVDRSESQILFEIVI